MKRALALLVCIAALVGCETEGGLLITTAAQGTQIQAQRLVARVYGTPFKPLPYGSADIDNALQRMQARWPQVKAGLDHGVLGLTDNGEIAVRVAGADAVALRHLVRDENRDRQLLYRGMVVAVGHGDAAQLGWLAYTEDEFAKEWAKQAPENWWVRGSNLVWRKKSDQP